jgi:hypothetical protein
MLAFGGKADSALTSRTGVARVLRGFSRWLHPIPERRAKFSASHATLDPDRACSAAQDGTRSLSKAATRLTQMMKAGDTFLYVRRVMISASVPGTIRTT